MRITVLGPLEATAGDARLALGGPQQRLVLALLVARADTPVSTETLIDALWPADDPPPRARKTVQVYVANIRKVFGGADAPVESAPGGYVLRTGAVSVDAIDFEAAVSATGAGSNPDPTEVVDRLSAALALWNGTPYADLADSPVLTAEITRLDELRLVALERRIEVSLALGRHRDVLSELETLTTDHPYRERFTALYMLALYRSGRQAEALRAYRRSRLLLGEELGIDPSPEVQALEQAILTQDPALELPEASADDPSTAPAESRADAQAIRGYELRERLGRREGATRWRAYQPATGREVTLTVVDPEVANQPTFVKRFESETQRLAQLEHPHLVSIYDFWRDPGGAYIVMPRFAGGTLEASLRRGRWKLSAALRMLDQVGSALVALHRRGLHHGDLGPDQVFLDVDTNAYLAAAGLTDRPLIATDAAEAPLAASDVADLAALLRRTVAPEGLSTELAAELDRAGDHGRVEDFLRAVRQATGSDAVGVASDPTAERPAATNPYKGLRAFQEVDAPDFFGRETLVARLVETVAGRPLTAVVGPSGSGKSSVVKAGLIPAVRNGTLGGDWLVAEMFPGTFPFEELEAALLKVAVDRPDGLMADLTADDRGMLRVIKRVLPDDGTGLLLVIDQFEELFSLTPDEDTRRLFLDNLVTLGSDARSRVRVVLTLRADFFDRPLDHPEFGELVQRGLVTVAMPDQDSLAVMVSRPAREAGLDLEPGLVTEIVRDVVEQPGGLPLMQYALTELAERSEGRALTRAGYRASGGVLGALGQRAEEIYRGLPPSAHEVAERIFLRLVTVDDNADDTRRRIRRTELNALRLDRNAVESVLQAFGSFRLLSFDHDPTTRGPTVEVAHEALIREWPRLRSWVDQQREDLLLERRLREAVVEWEASGRDPGFLLRGARLAQFETWADTGPGRTTHDEQRLIAESRAAADEERADEQRRMRRLRRLVAVVGAALVVALVTGALALRERDRAEGAAGEAELQRDRAEQAAQEAERATTEALDQRDRAEAATEEAGLATLISGSAAQINVDEELSLLLALEAHRRVPGPETENALLNALTSSNRVASLEPLIGPSSSCAVRTTSSDGRTETAILDGRLISRDLDTGARTDHGPSPTPCGRWIASEEHDRVVVESPDGLRHWFGPYDGPLVAVDLAAGSYLVMASFRPNHRLVYVMPGPLGDRVALRDDRTGEQVGSPISAGERSYPLSWTATSDGSLFAVGYANEAGPDGDGRTFVIDGDTGETVFEFDTDWPAEDLAFDEANGQLVAWMLDGTIRTIDLTSREEVPDLRVALTTTSRPRDLGIRGDGIVVAVSESQIELLDRSIGPIQNPVGLRNPSAARIRSDGTVLIVAADGSVAMIDAESNSLIGRNVWDADPAAHPAFNKGLAAAMESPEEGSPSREVPVVVDLATGESTQYELITDTGEEFPADKIYPEPDGLWAFSWDNVMARWEGETMVDRLALGGLHQLRTQFGDLIAVIGEQDGTRVVDLVSTEEEATRVFPPVAAPDAIEVHPSLDGGLHVIDADGTLRTYDAGGDVIGEIATGLTDTGFITVDPATGNVALVAAPDALVIVDPATGAIHREPEIGLISTLGFGRDGELLVLVFRDGTVRLWDVERWQYAGTVWRGAGQASTASPAWYDEATGTMWVASSGKYLGIPLEPDSWVERACEIVSRDLTQEEWDRFVPGDEPRRSACT